MRYCTRCILPDTRPGIVIGPSGVCNACLNSESKTAQIDWARREASFREVVTNARARRKGYDCLVPVSGGKDSTWQVLTCLEYGLSPLCVTWRTPGRTALGQANLDNLISLGVDHIDYSISPKVEKKFMLRTFERCGSTAVPMHLAIFNIPLAIAVRFDIPLVVWGENAAFEYGDPSREQMGHRLDRKWIERFGVTHGTTAADWVGEDLSVVELTPYFGPSEQELEAKGVSAVFLGHYFPWDPRKTFEVARAHGFRSREAGPKTGTYDFADIDDDFISIHHYLKWHKFGITRAFDNLSLEIRNGRITRDQAIGILRARGDDTPHDDIRRFCDFVGITTERFFGTAETFRNPAVWCREGDTWRIPGFLIEDWSWR